VPGDAAAAELQIPEILDHGPFGMVLLDANLLIIEANEALCRMTGCARNELRNAPVFGITSDLNESQWQQFLQEAEKENSARREVILTKRIGAASRVKVILSTDLNKKQNLIHAVALFDDVVIDALEEPARVWPADHYRDLFENAIDAMFTLDTAGNISAFNKAAERITGCPASEALEMNVAQLLAPEVLPQIKQQGEKQLTGEVPEAFEIHAQAKDGRPLTLEITSRLALHEGKPLEYQSIARDVTLRIQGQEALRHAKERLESWVRELEERTREMSLLTELTDLLRACYSIDEAYSVITRIGEQIFPEQVGALYVINESRNFLEAFAAWGAPSLIQHTFTPDDCWALRRGRAHFVEETQTGMLCRHLHTPCPSSYICVPMMAQGQALGILHLTYGSDKTITEERQKLALALAEHIAMALSNLRLNQTLRSQSIRDSLTGLFNRRFMEESLELEIRRAARGQYTLGILTVDLDNFIDYNQKFGRDVGDAILRTIGSQLQANIRKEDIVCHCGGPRFAMILPKSTFDVAYSRAEFFCNLVRETKLTVRKILISDLKVSVGLSLFPQHGQTVEAIMRAAETALQRAKDEGGDRVIVAP
jgi:diguanylate cyclase (GGDEF)-like protein/PAS domain S-box-containing protein